MTGYEEKQKFYTDATASVETMEERHIKIDNAIFAIDELRGQATTLLENITNRENNDKISADEPKRHRPSLAEVLETSPDRINKSCQEVSKVLDEIRSVLL